ncbi:hypothetical protein ACLOJK_023958 [Asimina triloba]
MSTTAVRAGSGPWLTDGDRRRQVRVGGQQPTASDGRFTGSGRRAAEQRLRAADLDRRRADLVGSLTADPAIWRGRIRGAMGRRLPGGRAMGRDFGRTLLLVSSTAYRRCCRSGQTGLALATIQALTDGSCRDAYGQICGDRSDANDGDDEADSGRFRRAAGRRWLVGDDLQAGDKHCCWTTCERDDLSDWTGSGTTLDGGGLNDRLDAGNGQKWRAYVDLGRRSAALGFAGSQDDYGGSTRAGCF